MDELHIDETPLQHIQRLRPTEGQPRLRARLAEIDAEIPAIVSRVHRDARGRLTYLKRTASENQLKLVRRDTIDGLGGTDTATAANSRSGGFSSAR